MQSTFGGVIMAIGLTLAYLGTIFWARQSHDRDRWLVLIAATSTGLILFIINQFAYSFGLWNWWGYSLPLIVQASLLFLGPSFLFVLIISGYRWLVNYTQRPLLIYGLMMIIFLAPITLLGDLYSIAQGTLSFGGRYTVWQDVIVGQVFAWLPIVLYQALRRWDQTSLSKHKAG